MHVFEERQEDLMASNSGSDDKNRLVEVLENLRSGEPKKLTDYDRKNPSQPPAYILPGVSPFRHVDCVANILYLCSFLCFFFSTCSLSKTEEAR